VDQKLFGQGQYLKSLIIALVESIIKEILHFENSTLRLFNILKGLSSSNLFQEFCFLSFRLEYAGRLYLFSPLGPSSFLRQCAQGLAARFRDSHFHLQEAQPSRE
jgi:hypothetical protein